MGESTTETAPDWRELETWFHGQLAPDVWPGLPRTLAMWEVADRLAAADGCWYDAAAGEHAVNWVQRHCRHVLGALAGQRIILEEWQKCCIRRLFGWKRRITVDRRQADGSLVQMEVVARRFTSAFFEIPRKNGKSVLGACIALYLLFADGEMGPEVYSIASDQKQAGIVGKIATGMVNQNPALKRRCEALAQSIKVPRNFGVYEILTKVAETKHGFNASGVISDETHAQSSEDLHETLATSMAARTQPLVIDITTSGFDTKTFCYKMHEKAVAVLEGTLVDHSHFAFIASAIMPGDEGVNDATKEIDWMDEAVWRKANPNFGISVGRQFFVDEFAKAKGDAAKLNTRLRLYLNIWTAAKKRHIDPARWKRCGGAFDLAALHGRKCYGGLDMAAVEDFVAFVLFFPPEHRDDVGYMWPWFWLPSAKVEASKPGARIPLMSWAMEGWLNQCRGATIEDDDIIAKVDELGGEFDVRGIAFDRWGSNNVRTKLEAAGFNEDHGRPMVQWGQGFQSFTPAVRAYDKLIAAERLQHGDHPIMTWMAGNLVVVGENNAAKPSKEKSSEKIDGQVAALMAVGLWDMLEGDEDQAPDWRDAVVRVG